MWQMSKRAAFVLQAVCSSTIEVYWMGMSHPPKGAILAPIAT